MFVILECESRSDQISNLIFKMSDLKKTTDDLEPTNEGSGHILTQIETRSKI